MLRISTHLLCAVAGAALALMAGDPRLLDIGAQARSAKNATYQALNLFGDVFERIRADYVEKPSDEKLIAAAIEGMLAELDPRSTYLDAAKYRDMQTQTAGTFGGVGLEVKMDGGLVKVVWPIEGGPAGRAGVRTNDVIVALDDAPVQGLTLNQAVEKMRGPLNTPIRLRIQRSGEDRPIELTIYREVITLRPVSYRVEDDVGYIRVRQFNERTTDGVKDALGFLAARIPADRLKGYVLDLRNNSGGLLDQAISVSDVFLESGEILSTRGRAADETQRFSARPGDLAYGKPLVVLVNHGSAAATEAVAAALQYHRRAIVVGSRSFGRGSIQTMIPLGEGRGMLRLTTAHMFTPGGNPIEGVGITPDVEVLQKAPLGSDAEVTSQVASCGGDQYEEQAATAYVPTDPDDDKALQTAFGLLRGGARPATEQHR